MTLHSSSCKVAAILVGGKGTRLQSVISTVPKPLAPIAGEPFLFHLLRLLKKAGIEKIILLTGYMHKQIKEACGDGKHFQLDICYSEENEPRGTAGAIRNAQHLLREHTDFLVLNGDTFFDESILEIIHHSLASNELGLIGVTQILDATRYGSLQINPENFYIEKFLEKNQATSEFVNAGIYKLSAKILNHIPENSMQSLEYDIFPKLTQQKNTLKAVILKGKFHDIGLPESYHAFNQQWVEESYDNRS